MAQCDDLAVVSFAGQLVEKRSFDIFKLKSHDLLDSGSAL